MINFSLNGEEVEHVGRGKHDDGPQKIGFGPQVTFFGVCTGVRKYGLFWVYLLADRLKETDACPQVDKHPYPFPSSLCSYLVRKSFLWSVSP